MSATEPRRVLIATGSLFSLTGADRYTRDLALALLGRGYLPVVYTPGIGEAAEELRQATIPVVTDIDAIGARPDVIHGHHSLETVTALAKFRDVPALFVCHDALDWNSVPPVSRRIRAWVAVDRNCRDRMVFEHGVPEESVRLWLNAVDMERFRRRSPLPPKPRRAAVFSNGVTENGFAAPIRAACSRRGIDLELVGSSAGRPAVRPEEVLTQYDLVFAKGRCALEAAAVGAAVVLCDARGLGGMLTTGSLDALRQLNFGARTLQRPITPETIGAEIDRYDAADAAAVCDRIRASAGIDLLADQYIALYDELCASPPETSAAGDLDDLALSLSNVSKYLRTAQKAGRPRGERLRNAIVNSRLLSWPVHLAYRIKKRLKL